MRETPVVAAPSVRVASGSHVGQVRSNNEDRVYADPERGGFAVIDGVGGQAAGEFAAEAALDTIRQRLQLQIGTPAERVREAIALANDQIYQQGQAHPDRHGMACVLTLVLLQNGTLTAGHVGDTRLYKIRGGVLRKLTHDHSPIGEREDSGELTESEAMRHPRRNEVYREVGAEPRGPDDEGFIEVIEEPFETDAALLLCSDGLTDVLSSAAIAGIIERHGGEPAQVVDRLIDRANEAGGKDNVSVVYVEGAMFGRKGARPGQTGRGQSANVLAFDGTPTVGTLSRSEGRPHVDDGRADASGGTTGTTPTRGSAGTRTGSRSDVAGQGAAGQSAAGQSGAGGAPAGSADAHESSATLAGAHNRGTTAERGLPGRGVAGGTAGTVGADGATTGSTATSGTSGAATPFGTGPVGASPASSGARRSVADAASGLPTAASPAGVSHAGPGARQTGANATSDLPTAAGLAGSSAAHGSRHGSGSATATGAHTSSGLATTAGVGADAHTLAGGRARDASARSTTSAQSSASVSTPGFLHATAASRVFWFVSGLLAGVAIALGVAYVMRDVLVPQIQPLAPGPRTLIVDPSAPAPAAASSTVAASTSGVVPPTTFRTIGHALEAARAGDTIQVSAGEYREQIVVPDGVNLIARVPRAAILRAPAQALQPFTSIIVSGTRHESRVSGFKIAGDPQAPITIGVHVLGRASLDDLEVSGTTVAGIELAGGTMSVTSSALHDNAGTGVALKGGDARLAHNVLLRNGGAAAPSGADVVLTAAPQVAFLGNVFGADPAQRIRGLAADQIARVKDTNIVLPPPASAPAARPRAGANRRPPR